jgi:hypothetical protein
MSEINYTRTDWVPATEFDRLREQLYVLKPVADAAEKWAEAIEGQPYQIYRGAEGALYEAVERMRLMVLALDAAEREHAEAVTR